MSSLSTQLSHTARLGTDATRSETVKSSHDHLLEHSQFAPNLYVSVLMNYVYVTTRTGYAPMQDVHQFFGTTPTSDEEIDIGTPRQ